MSGTTRAPVGDIASYSREAFTHRGVSHDVYRKGSGPAVIVLSEIPGITPQQLGFADRLAAMGCSAILPHMFGTPGRSATRKPGSLDVPYALRSVAKVCISREFSMFAAGASSPIIDWLRALAAAEHERCKGPGVGVIGMCLTGGFALAMAVDPHVLVPVLSQPSLPATLSAKHRNSIDCSAADLERVAWRCANEQLRVVGLRFHGDPLVPKERFEFLKRALGDGFVAVELPQSAGHPEGFLARRHSILTHDLIDEPGELTRAALDQVLHMLRTKLFS
ncbi:MAG TPA: dienelactone hydrolase family protein [Polyangiales bacterium]|jgi:dienelactone hydrolase|nr:dienelactone hydrolase family protein [Polyangiales bacterium]